VVCSPLGSLGTGKLYILGVAGYVTPIWDVLAPKGEREEAGEHIYSAKTNQIFSQLGKRCQLALLWLGFATVLVRFGFSNTFYSSTDSVGIREFLQELTGIPEFRRNPAESPGIDWNMHESRGLL